MHDSEPETFVIKSIPEKFSDILDSIGVSSTPKEIATDDVENDDYYSRHFLKLQEWLLTKVVLT